MKCLICNFEHCEEEEYNHKPVYTEKAEIKYYKEIENENKDIEIKRLRAEVKSLTLKCDDCGSKDVIIKCNKCSYST